MASLADAMVLKSGLQQFVAVQDVAAVQNQVTLHPAGYMVKGYSSRFFGDKNTKAKSTMIVTASEVVKGLAGANKDDEVITLKVLWEPNKYKVKLDMNDGNSDSKAVPVVSSVSFAYDTKLGDTFKEIAANGPKAPTRPGYKFVGWTKTPISPTGTGNP